MSIIMSGLEFNKIIASIIVAVIIFVIIGFIGNYLVKINQDNSQETAYVIDIIEEDINVQKEVDNTGTETISPLLANASLTNGEKIYKKCATCHNYTKNSKSKVGPNLWNLINRPKASVSNFTYSKVLFNFGGDWNYEELNKFLYKPKDYIAGTKMNFAGLKNTQDRADLILWLRQHSDDPVPIP